MVGKKRLMDEKKRLMAEKKTGKQVGGKKGDGYEKAAGWGNAAG